MFIRMNRYKNVLRSAFHWRHWTLQHQQRKEIASGSPSLILNDFAVFKMNDRFPLPYLGIVGGKDEGPPFSSFKERMRAISSLPVLESRLAVVIRRISIGFPYYVLQQLVAVSVLNSDGNLFSIPASPRHQHFHRSLFAFPA